MLQPDESKAAQRKIRASFLYVRKLREKLTEKEIKTTTTEVGG